VSLERNIYKKYIENKEKDTDDTFMTPFLKGDINQKCIRKRCHTTQLSNKSIFLYSTPTSLLCNNRLENSSI
jgi:hypothetical protein